MGTVEKITISLSAEMLSELKDAVAKGEYTNTSEAVRDALRRWQRSRTVIALNDEELRRLVTEGIDSGPPVNGEAFMKRLIEKYAAMADESNT